MTAKVTRVKVFDNTALLRELTSFNGKLYFHAAPFQNSTIYKEGGQTASVIWETDGTEEGTKLLYDFAPGPAEFVPSKLRVANNHLFIEVRIDSDPSHYELWSLQQSSHSSNFTEPIKLVDSLNGRFPDWRFDDRIEPTSEGLFFLQKDSEGRNELWFTNGKPGAANTYSLGGNTSGAPLNNFVKLIGGDNTLYFIADGSESVPGSDYSRHDPNELWSTTSTPGSFNKLSDFDYRIIGSYASPIQYEETIGDSLYFTGRQRYGDSNYDLEPWISEGTYQTTGQIENLNPEWYSQNTPSSTIAKYFTSYKNEVYFIGYKRWHINQDLREHLYAYNPISGDIRLVAQTSEESGNWSHRELFVFNDYLYFDGHNDETGWELWRSDGTSAGTGLFKDLSSVENPDWNEQDSNPQDFTIHKKGSSTFPSTEDDLYFHDKHGKLWKLSGKTEHINEVEIDDRLFWGVERITAVKTKHNTTDVYFNSAQTLFVISADNQHNDNIIYSSFGKGKLWGTREANQFTFDQFEPFSKKTADLIVRFKPSHGDTIGISATACPSLLGADEITFATARNAKEAKRLSRQDIDFVYFQDRGRLFFNGNGAEKGWGGPDEGGIFAFMHKKPELSAEDFTLLA